MRPVGGPASTAKVMHLPEIIDSIHGVRSDGIAPYLEQNRRQICEKCSLHHSSICPCPMDYLAVLAALTRIHTGEEGICSPARGCPRHERSYDSREPYIGRRVAVSNNTGTLGRNCSDKGADAICSATFRPNGASLTLNQIQQRAYVKWLAAGKPEGDGSRFWLAAEQELLLGK